MEVMIAGTDPRLIVLVACAACTLVTYVVVKLHNRNRISHRVAELEIRFDSEWTLALIAEPGRKYNLGFEFHIEHPGAEDDFGLVADYACLAGDGPQTVEKAGIGNLSQSDQCRRIMSSYNVSLTSIAGWSKYRATVVICTAGPFSDRTEIKAIGKVIASPGVELKRGLIFFSRQGW
ncbi:MAG: hypothetical protein JXR55_04170 [Candidatus Fermentibacteraceae bacterium]|nr:hypothetical protein [Candidatus Fermentibacteraceae bacterium]